MLHSDLTPKPVYGALKKLIHEQWHTRVEGTTDETGRLAVHGFFGQYEVRISKADRQATRSLRLSQHGPKETGIALPTR